MSNISLSWLVSRSRRHFRNSNHSHPRFYLCAGKAFVGTMNYPRPHLSPTHTHHGDDDDGDGDGEDGDDEDGDGEDGDGDGENDACDDNAGEDELLS